MTDLLACPVPHPALPPAIELDADTQAIVDRTGHGAVWGQFGHAADIMHSWLKWYQPIMLRGRVEVKTKELCRLRVAALNGCHY